MKRNSGRWRCVFPKLGTACRLYLFILFLKYKVARWHTTEQHNTMPYNTSVDVESSHWKFNFPFFTHTPRRAHYAVVKARMYMYMTCAYMCKCIRMKATMLSSRWLARRALYNFTFVCPTNKRERSSPICCKWHENSKIIAAWILVGRYYARHQCKVEVQFNLVHVSSSSTCSLVSLAFSSHATRVQTINANTSMLLILFLIS